MKDEKKGLPDAVEIRRKDGAIVKVVVPKTAIDVESQPDIPAYALALVAFSPVDPRTGWLRWSPHARDVLSRLTEQYGEPEVRRQLIGVLIDMEQGFKPLNPIGLLVHRVRTAGTTKTLQI